MIKVVLSSIIEIISGGTPLTSVEEYWNNGNIGWLSVTDFNNDLRYVYESEKQITEKGLKESNTKLLQYGDIIISARGTVGALAQIGKPMCFNQSCFGIRGKKDKVDNDFLYYALKNYVQHIKKRSQGSVFDTINLKSFDLMEIEIPKSVAEQQKIAKVLSDLDTKIELNNRINTELEAMAKTLYDYWFVQFDFPYVTSSGVEKPYKTSGGKMVWNAELNREIPEGWESGELKDLFNLNPTLSIKKGAVSSYIDMNALPTDGYMTKAVQEKEFSGGVKFQNGDIIVARITPCLENGKTGLITLLEEDEIGFGSTEFIVLRGKNMTLSCFGAFLSRSELFRKYAIANMLGTSGRKRVEASKIGSFPIAIPKEAILKKFEKVISAHFKQETINTKENQELASLRDWLLPMLMNGQVSVGDVAVLRQAQDDMLGMVAEASARYEK